MTRTSFSSMMSFLVVTLLLTSNGVSEAKRISAKNHNKKKGGHKKAPMLGGTSYKVQNLSSPSAGESFPGDSTTGFGTWILPQGTSDNPVGISAWSGCDGKAFTPITKICINSGIYLDRISFMFKNGETYTYGGTGGGSYPNVSSWSFAFCKALIIIIQHLSCKRAIVFHSLYACFVHSSSASASTMEYEWTSYRLAIPVG